MVGTVSLPKCCPRAPAGSDTRSSPAGPVHSVAVALRQPTTSRGLPHKVQPTAPRCADLGLTCSKFRRVNGQLHLPALRTALDAEVRKAVGPWCKMRTSTQPDTIGPPPKFHGLRDNLGGTLSESSQRSEA
jgi:hypothetical protein